MKNAQNNMEIDIPSIEEMADFYEKDERFRQYVSRFCVKHKHKTWTAFKWKLVKEVYLYYLHDDPK